MMRNTFEDVLGGMEVIQSHVEWLHLSECVTFQGGVCVTITGSGGLLRIRTVDVSGWMFGAMTAHSA